MAQRILIVEEALKNRQGHWYEYNRAIIEEARGRGMEVVILAHRDIEPDIRDELKAQPFFPVTSWDHVYYHPSRWRRYIGIVQHNLHIARLLSRHFRDAVKPYDVVLVPTVVLYHWLAWRWLVFRGAGSWFKRVVLTTLNNAGEYDQVSRRYRFNASAKMLRQILKSFRRPVQTGSAEMASDSQILASQYEELSGVRFHTYPHPRPTAHLAIHRAKRASKERVFTALGPPRYEKGSDLIIQAITKLLAEEADFPGRFVVHWSCKVFNPSGAEYLLPEMLWNHPKVEIIRHNLTSEEYQQRLEGADVILLPYRRSQYHARISGIAIEAFQSGVPCICVSETWIEGCMEEIGAGIALKEESVNALLDAIRRMASSDGEGLSQERIRVARRFHSPESFIDQLVASVS